VQLSHKLPSLSQSLPCLNLEILVMRGFFLPPPFLHPLTFPTTPPCRHVQHHLHDDELRIRVASNRLMALVNSAHGLNESVQMVLDLLVRRVA